MAETKTIVLLSGGPDSATLLRVIEKKRQAAGGGVVNALYLKSGFPSDENEIAAARTAIEAIGGKLEVADISDVVKRLGGARPTYHAGAEVATFGNTMILSIAMSYAAANGYRSLAIGLHRDDAHKNYEYSGSYIGRFASLTREVDAFAPSIETPFADMTKSEVFALGRSLGVNFAATWSCIEGRALHCGTCGACLARHHALITNGMDDKTKYAVQPQFGGHGSEPFERTRPEQAEAIGCL
jgi:7-cyano-7-deazaguanine synthase